MFTRVLHCIHFRNLNVSNFSEAMADEFDYILCKCLAIDNLTTSVSVFTGDLLDGAIRMNAFCQYSGGSIGGSSGGTIILEANQVKLFGSSYDFFCHSDLRLWKVSPIVLFLIPQGAQTMDANVLKENIPI